ncbi:PEP-CTERM sorting domain-containing protein [Pseudoduganella plicata]|nr:PEP-CTERM sorting domain-containing protein [Pseudoduganella plicata]
MLRNMIAAALLSAGFVQHAAAAIVTVAGDTTGGPTFIRPGDVGEDPYPWLTGMAYRAFDIVTSAGPNEFNWENSLMTSCDFGCVTFLYAGPFDPEHARKNLMSFDTDGYNFSAMQTFLEPGKHYTYVVTGYFDQDAGAFSITAGGQGGISISAVPEPSAGLMLLGGLAAIGALARRRASDTAQRS